MILGKLDKIRMLVIRSSHLNCRQYKVRRAKRHKITTASNSMREAFRGNYTVVLRLEKITI